jgi:Predicted periplasmic protein (DUF2271)
MHKIRNLSAIFLLVIGSVSSLFAADGLTITATALKGYPSKGSWYRSSEMFAVLWVADTNNKFVRTVGKWGKWESKTCRKWDKAGKTGSVDAITAATVKLGTKTEYEFKATWSLKDVTGKIVPNGKYNYYFEFSNQEYQGPWMKGSITIGGNGITSSTIDSSGTGISGDQASKYITGFSATYTTATTSLLRNEAGIQSANGFITPDWFTGAAEVSAINLRGDVLWKEKVTTTPGFLISQIPFQNRNTKGIMFLRAKFGNQIQTRKICRVAASSAN